MGCACTAARRCSCGYGVPALAGRAGSLGESGVHARVAGRAGAIHADLPSIEPCYSTQPATEKKLRLHPDGGCAGCSPDRSACRRGFPARFAVSCAAMRRALLAGAPWQLPGKAALHDHPSPHVSSSGPGNRDRRNLRDRVRFRCGPSHPRPAAQGCPESERDLVPPRSPWRGHGGKPRHRSGFPCADGGVHEPEPPPAAHASGKSRCPGQRHGLGAPGGTARAGTLRRGLEPGGPAPASRSDRRQGPEAADLGCPVPAAIQEPPRCAIRGSSWRACLRTSTVP